MNSLRRDKTAFEIGMDNSGSRRRFVTGVNRPGACLLFSGGEKRAQTKQMIDRPDKRVHTTVFHTEAMQIFQRILVAKIDQFTFDLGADDHGLCGKMMFRVILNCCDVLACAVTGIVHPGFHGLRCVIATSPTGPCHTGQIRFRDVAGENCWL